MNQNDIDTPSSIKQIKSFRDCDEVTDCIFIIDGQEVKANRLKLTNSSPVFEKMFFGELASNRITITDIPLEDFCQMLEFIYTDSVKIESVLEAWSLFYIAQKYLLSDFAKVCVAYIRNNVSINSLILSLEYAEVYEIKELQQECMKVVQKYVRGVFHDKCEYHMKPSSVLRILEQDILNISNEDLVKCILQWAVTECDMQNISLSAQNIIFLLGSLNILQCLNLDFAVDRNCHDLILECCKLIKNLNESSVSPKNYLKKHWCTFCKCRLNYKIAGRLEMSSGDSLISNMSVNCDAFLFGLVIATEDKQFGITDNEYSGSIKIQISEIGDPELTVTTTVTKSLPYDTQIYVPLAELIFLECDKVYSLKIKYTNFDKNVRYSSILCNYMSNKLSDGNTVFSFDELYGGVIKGICYFAA